MCGHVPITVSHLKIHGVETESQFCVDQICDKRTKEYNAGMK